MKKLLRFLLWSCAALVTVYALLCAWINWAGAKANQQALARVAEEGETLDFKALLPPPVDPAKNFFAIEPLKDLALIIDNDTDKGAPAEKRKALEAMKIEAKNSGPLAFHGVRLGRRADMEAFANMLRQSELGASITGAQTEQAMRLALEMNRPQILLLTSELQRAEAEFTPTFGQRKLPENLFALPLPHYNGPMKVGHVLHLHGVACAEAGDAVAAIQDARVLLRFSAACQREPLLISLLVGVTLQAQAHELVWQTLVTQKANAESLSVLQQELSMDGEAVVLQALRGEMAAASSIMDYAKKSSAAEVARLFGGIDGGGIQPGLSGRIGIWLMPQGYLAWNHGTLVEAELNGFILPLKKGGLAALADAAGTLETEIKDMNKWSNLHKLLASLAIPSVIGIAERVIATETQRRQALIACALERYFVQHQAYPAALADLVPQFLDQVPSDVMDGKPMRYRKTEKGRYVIWATGFDGKDDGGKVNATPDTVADLYKREYLGDWAWQYEPVM